MPFLAKRSSLYLVAAVLWLICRPAPGNANSETQSEAIAQSRNNQASESELIKPWDAMDLQFRQLYAEARSRKLQEQGPIIILRDDKIILRYRGETRTKDILSPRYHLLKSIDHVPLAIFVTLEGKTDGRLDDKEIESIVGFKKLVDEASSNIKAWKLAQDVLARQERILHESVCLMQKAIDSRIISRVELNKFARTMGPLVLANADQAEVIELSNIDDAVRNWKRELGETEWRRLRVVIMAPHMPRQEERAMLYFKRHMHEEQEGNRIVYAENASDEDYALNLLATHALDREVAVGFFKDPWRMHRDFLSDAAKLYLRTHKIEKQ